MTKPETDPTAQAGVTDAMVEAVAEIVWQDFAARYGGEWLSADTRSVAKQQCIATARAALEAALAAQPEQTTEAVGRMGRSGGFETEHGHFTDGEEVIYIDPNGKKWQGVLGEVLPDGEADFVSAEWSRGGTYKWRFFRKLPATLAPAPPSTGAEPAMVTAQRGFDTWAAKPHNAKWARKIDGTPIPGDLVVCIAEAFMAVVAPAPQEQVSERYTPKIIHFDGEGDPHWEFVERDCPTITDLVFAANVEKLLDADRNLIGFRIYDPASPVAAVSEREDAIEKATIDDETAILQRLEDGDEIAYSKDGENAWFTRGDRAWIGDTAVIELRAKGYLHRHYRDDEDEHGVDVISNEGRAAIRSLARPRTTGGQG